jgi:hypothetical protein
MTWNKNRTRSCPYCVATMLGLERAKRIVKSDGTKWEVEALRDEFRRQLSEAADGQCPRCAG